MKLIFEKSVAGRGHQYLPPCDVEEVALPASLVRENPPKLPEVSETDLSRHYTELNKHVHGVNSGFYPLGSCTMKYNPRIDEEMAALPGFTAIHPLAPKHTTLGCQEALATAEQYLNEIFGMDACTFQPAAGAHGEFPGVGAVGCKKHLIPYMPKSVTMDEPGHIQVRSFVGNFLVTVKALTYVMTLGKEGIPEAAKNAVLNANYLQEKIKGTFTPAFDRICMHEFVLDLSDFKKATGVSAMDVAKSLIDYGMHPPTMYFPLIVHEALMLEPTETESKETLDWAAEVFRALYELGYKDPDFMHGAPHSTHIGRPDDVRATRTPVVRYQA